MSIASQLSFSTATSVRGGALGSIPYQNATSSTVFVSIGAAGSLLISNGTAPIWHPASSTTVGTSTQVQTVLRSTAATHFLAFVDSNNASATAEAIYTTSSFTINPATGFVGIGGGTVGSILSTEENTTGTTELRITNSNIGANVTKTSRLTFRLTDTVGTRKDVAYISAIPVNADSSAGDHLTFATRTADATPTEKLRITNNGGIAFGGASNYGSSGQILQSNGNAAPTWVTATGLAAGSASTATNIAGGTAGQVPYQTAAGVTSFYGPGTAGNVLVSNGTSAPSYNNTLTLAGTTAATSTATGALQVRGGVGIGDNLFVNNNINAVSGQFVSARANNAATGAGQIYLDGATGNRIDFNQNGVAAPAFTTRSAGTKLVLYSNLSGSAVDYAIGIETSSLWSSVPNTSSFFKWYGGTTLAATLAGTGNLTLVGDLAVNGGDITTTQTTFGLVDATAATVNFARAATALTMGAVSGTTNVRNNLTVSGNLTVQGTTTIVDSTVTNIADPILTLGGGTGNTAPTADDNKDRGIAFKWVNNGGTTSTGFFGYDDSTGFLTYIQTATITNEVVSGTKGAADINLAGGSAMALVYQSSANNTGFLAAGTSGYILQTNGTGSSPSWVAATGLSAGSSANSDAIRTIAQTANASYFLTFVDSNNATNAYEAVYTTSSFTINPATGNIVATGNVTAPSFSIQTNTTPAVFIKDDNLTAWDYSGKSFAVSGQETGPSGLFFKPDGLAMYIIGSTGDDVNQYSLSVAWDLSTAAFVRVSVAIGETAPTGVFFKPDGLVMYITGTTNDTVREFSLSTAWDVSTIAFVRDFSVATQDTAPQDIWFKPDGTKMYVVGSTNDRVYEYNLSTAWNVSTASFLQFFSVAAQDTVPVAVNFNSDGTKMYVLGDTGDDINRYTLSTPWNISTAVFFNNFYVGFQETSPQGLFINFDSNTAYVVGSATDAVYQYTTLTDGIELISSSGLFVEGSLYTNRNLLVTSGTRLDGTLSVSGATTLDSTLVVGSSVTLGSNVTMATTTGAVNLGTSQTTGATIIGGLTQTGGLTLGRSTGAQTVDIAVGATTNGTIKLINVGANGVSGSITNINVGSTVTGALGTLTINSTQTVITSTTNASSTATGALQVRGGVGIGGNLWVGGTINGNINGTATNSTDADAIRTVARTTAGAHYLTFVDSNNASNAYESLYTTSSFSINPQTGFVGIGSQDGGSPLNVKVLSTLSGTINSFQKVLTTQAAGGLGNNVYRSEWRRRRAAGTDWTTQNIHDGIWVDASFTTPGVDTRTWWDRDPSTASQAWGDQATTWMFVNSTGLGVGTTSPQAKFVVSNGGANGLEVSPNGGVNSGALLQSYNRSGATYTHMSHYASAHTFNVGSAGSTRAVDIDSNGNVGIGTINPLAKLHVGLTGSANMATTTISSLTNVTSTARAGFSGLANNNDGIYFGTGLDGGICAGLGLFREAAGWNSAIAFYTNNITDGTNVGRFQEKMRITSNGGVSFGATGTAYGTSGQILQSNGDAAPTWVAASGLTAGIASQVQTVLRTTSAAHYLTFVDSNNASATGETVYTTSSFSINPATGAVGINGVGGTALNLSVPSSVIDRYFLNGTAAVNSFSIYDNSNTPYINSYASMAFRANQIGGTGGHFYFSGGNLMIGTGTPGAPLSFTDSLTTKIQLNANAANSYTIGKAAAVNSGDSMTKFVAGATSAGEFGFYNTTNLRLLINNNGAVLINRSSQVGTSRLHVTGGSNTVEYVARIAKGTYADTGGHTTLLGFGCEDSTWSKTAIGHTRTSSYDAGYFGIYVSNDTLSGTDASTSTHRRVRVDASGVEITNALGVGTGASGVAGEIRATNEITAYYSSDIRLKENIRLIADPITIVNQIRGVYYDWTDEHIKTRGGEDGYFVRKHDIGVIAQEVEKVLPEIVATRDDGTKVVKYEKIVALLIEAVKDQQQQINQLSDLVNTLVVK